VLYASTAPGLLPLELEDPLASDNVLARWARGCHVVHVLARSNESIS
jgi:hypothetical protein